MTIRNVFTLIKQAGANTVATDDPWQRGGYSSPPLTPEQVHAAYVRLLKGQVSGPSQPNVRVDVGDNTLF